MPELPEVETIVRTLTPQVAGRVISAVTAPHPKVLQQGEALLPLLSGGRVERIFRRAKLLLFAVRPRQQAGDILLAFHLKMTGRFFVHPEGTEPLKHTRIIFDLSEDDEGLTPAGRLFFDDMRTFGWCRVMRPDELADWPFWRNLGPEPLELSRDELAAHLASRFSGRARSVKACLLDQTILAGIGNIYADEALFKAGIRPSGAAASLDGAGLAALAGALQEILALAIRECGSSIRDYRDALGNAGAFQNNFAVYGRKGETCLACGGPLQSARVAGRGTVYCPACQR
ncbi:MAG: bifunctional DNA-formamidopyrimidine glycosylase/DNA-(apurinic or apyrimidinic site) lyase [Desulfovibrio sp.]|jgi:formamidopyrimidine-DNA glycosylase|nr:bifunctional DNA-formamidopyrimidine glycosylase/DNA-(apurinic or apyrimidinic site) lyase [Desulfovibrio sp.]